MPDRSKAQVERDEKLRSLAIDEGRLQAPGGDNIVFDDQHVDLTGVRDLRGAPARTTAPRYGGTSPGALDALNAAAESGQVYTRRAADRALSDQIDVSSLYSADGPTPAAAAYETSVTKQKAPANPRQADRVSDAQGLAGKVVRIAQQFIGVPYVWGGSTPSGFDCSGLMKYIFAKVGVNLPRVSYQQAEAGPAVSAKDARAGDLGWMDNSTRNNGADHVFLYLGGGLILEAPRPGVPVRIRHLGSDEGAHFTRVLGG